MSDKHKQLHEMLLRDLAELKLTRIAATYREVLDDAARKNSSLLDVLAALLADEVAGRRQRALERRIHQAKLPKLKTLADYKFDFPQRIPKQKVLRLFDCEFITQRQCAVLIGPTGARPATLRRPNCAASSANEPRPGPDKSASPAWPPPNPGTLKPARQTIRRSIPRTFRSTGQSISAGNPSCWIPNPRGPSIRINRTARPRGRRCRIRPLRGRTHVLRSLRFHGTSWPKRKVSRHRRRPRREIMCTT